MSTLKLKSGSVGAGSTKVLVVTPKDGDGTPIVPSILTAVFTKDGEEHTYTLSDFAASQGRYEVEHTFSDPGTWTVVVTAADADGRSEKKRYTVVVLPT